MITRTGTIKLVKVLRRPQLLVAVGESVLLLATAEASLRVADLRRVARWFGATLEFTDTAPGLAVEALDISVSERRRLAVLSRIAQRWPLAPQGACLRHSLSAAHMLQVAPATAQALCWPDQPRWHRCSCVDRGRRDGGH